MDKQSSGFISYFLSHRVASNLLVLIFLILGAIGLSQLHTRFLPEFSLNTVVVSVTWPGANPTDIEQAITTPIEKQLGDIDNVLRMSSVSSQGLSMIVVEFNHGINMAEATQRVRDQLGLVDHSPDGSRPAEVTLVQIYDPIARIILSTDDHPRALRHWAYQAQQELLERGVDKVEINGLPDEQLQVNIPMEQLLLLRQHLGQIADNIHQQSQNVAAGTLDGSTYRQSVRSDSKVTSTANLREIPIISGDAQTVIRLLNIAGVVKRPERYAQTIRYKDKPAVELTLFRSQNADTLQTAKLLSQWKKEAQSTWPDGIHIKVYYEFWKVIKERIGVLIDNGSWGLIFIFVLLFLFLRGRVALWVSLAIPLSILGALFCLWVFGGSINMISLFALIMTLGIIVDDTIVVAEEGVRLYQSGKSPHEAAGEGAQRMLTPIMASSLTTLAAFSPLLLLKGMMGEVLFAIPLVVICVVIASLIECFLILPYHVSNSLKLASKRQPSYVRSWLDNAFVTFRDDHYRRFILYCMRHKLVLLTTVIASIVLSLGLVTSGRLTFTFFPSPDGTLVNADITFHAGVTQSQMSSYLKELERSAREADASLSPDESLIQSMVQYFYQGTDRNETRNHKRLGSVVLELTSPEVRRISNQDFIDAWRQRLVETPWVDSVRIMPPRKGMPGSDIDIALYGSSAETLKQASMALQKVLQNYKGVYNVTDTMPYAKNAFTFQLTHQAHALGITTQQIGEQVRAAFAGAVIQTHYLNQDRIAVSVKIQASHDSALSTLEHLPIKTAKGAIIPLGSLVTIHQEKAFDTLQHLDRQLVVHVVAEVDRFQGNAQHIMTSVIANELSKISHRYGVQYVMKGRSMEEANTINEMKVAVIAMLLLIFLILAWVSSSFIWPLWVMVAIPLGLEGAIWGHWLLGRELTLLSLFGFFGLTGIVINDSIILLFRYKELLATGMDNVSAIVEASCQRMRPVVLTSVTTIAGLSPLLFERSMQAQFLIPMAISICFGLLFSTVLILVVIPALVSAWRQS
ncbi:MAG: acriflavin resistance protein [Legionellales bacterium]|nr:acriflavin resistance protein [Legionellales bacterium]